MTEHARSLVSVGVPILTYCTAGVIVATIITTYILCVTADQCPVFLPTISNTWVNPPGNYISRIIIGVGSAALAAIQPGFYIASPGRPESSLRLDRERVNETWQKTRAILGVVACALLSIVAAVCDDNDAPGCQGNSTLHDTSAVLYFALYTVVSISYTADVVKHPNSNLKTIERTVLSAFGVISVVSKLRFFAPSHYVLEKLGSLSDFPLVPVIEWTDTVILLLLTCYYAAKAGVYLRAGIVRTPSSLQRGSSDDDEKRTSLLLGSKTGHPGSYLTSPPSFYTDAGIIYIAFVLVSFCSIFLSYVFALMPETGNVWPLPTLSEAWGDKPGNMLGRWGAVQGGFLFALIQVLLYYLTDPELTSFSGKSGLKIDSITIKGINISSQVIRAVLLSFGLLSSVSFALVGCINTSENAQVHDIVSLIAFVSYAVYVLITIITIIVESKYSSTIVKLATAGFKFLLSLRFVQSLNLSTLEALAPFLAYAELADILFNIGFVGILVFSNDWRDIGVAFLEQTE